MIATRWLKGVPAAVMSVLLLGGVALGKGPPTEIDRLVKQLGDDEFEKREAASQRLADIGEPALDALHKATKSNDAEVRRHAVELIANIERKLYGEIARFSHADGVRSIAVSPDGERLVSCSHDETVRLWQVATGKCLRTFEGQKGPKLDVALSADGKRVLSGGNDYTVRVWEADTGKEVQRFYCYTATVRAVAFAQDGKRAYSIDDNTLRVWDFADRQKRQTITEKTGVWLRSFAVTLDGKRVALCAGDENIKLWNLETGEVERTFTGHTASVDSLAISPDGKRLLSGACDKTLRLWNIETGKELSQFKGHTKAVCCVAFSPDGKRLLSGGDDNVVILWDVKTGKVLHSYAGHTEVVTSVVFFPDGKRIASGSYDKTIRVWPVRK